MLACDLSPEDGKFDSYGRHTITIKAGGERHKVSMLSLVVYKQHVTLPTFYYGNIKVK